MRKDGEPPHMATTRSTQHLAPDLPTSRRRPALGRLGQGLVTGAAAALTITFLPGTASAAGGTASPPPAATSSAPAPTPASQTAVDTTKAQLGDAYEYGAAGADSFDCSGLTQHAYAAAGIDLPHSSRSQSELGTPVARADLQPGDLVFYYSPVSHVGIYIGDGQMVNALNESTGVVVSNVDMEGYAGARRIA
jgi:cell wall-associated NlpC family hydrolase